jgi:endosialidase-like protein
MYMVRAEWSRSIVTGLVAVALLVAVPALAGPARPLAQVQAGGASLDWTPFVSHESMKLVVSGPDGLIIEREFRNGELPSLSIFDKAGQRIPDGDYRWELSASPMVSPAVKHQLNVARRNGDQAALARLQSQLTGGGVQSGNFRIANGAFVVDEGAVEPRNNKGAVAAAGVVAQDVVNADDFIVQGSECVGLDCVNNESFGFDTIRLKENNTRIKFDDTSTSAGFAANDWQLTANDSASGGSSKFSIEDITGSKVPFTITAGASTNSIFVDSTGRVGLRTSTPVLDLHIATSNTPAIRLEQNNSGGFTAQTWDIAGNEANFFVRDVTGGSRLPFRIRPGAPTSSIDINASGFVGIGTASPSAKLNVESSDAAAASVRYTNTNAAGFAGGEYFEGGTQGLFVGLDNANNVARLNAVNSYPLVILTNSTERIRFPAPGGSIITSPIGASLNSVGQWADASSRELKQDIHDMPLERAMATLKGLNPVTYEYKADPSEVQAGFIAEDVPQLVAQKDRKGLSALEIVAVLTKVVQQQQQTIDQLNARLSELEQKPK